jgi:hypothetical protein
VTDQPHCIVCGEPAAAFDARRDGWVCGAHALRVCEAQERAEWWLRFLDSMQPPGRRWLIGARRAE